MSSPCAWSPHVAARRCVAGHILRTMVTSSIDLYGHGLVMAGPSGPLSLPYSYCPTSLLRYCPYSRPFHLMRCYYYCCPSHHHTGGLVPATDAITSVLSAILCRCLALPVGIVTVACALPARHVRGQADAMATAVWPLWRSSHRSIHLPTESLPPSAVL